MSDQNLKELVPASGVPVTIMVGGQMFKAGMLQAADWAECAEWRSSAKAAKMLELPVITPSLDHVAIKAEACARILCQRVEPRDIIGDVECVYRLAEVMLKRGGDWKGTWDGFKRNLSPTSYRDLEKAVFRMSGFWTPEMEISVNPPVPAA